MEKVILTTGGTGGHIFPALAVAEELRKRYPDIRIVFMGSRHGPEARLAPANNLQFEGLKVKGFLGRGLRAIPAGFNMLVAILQARSFIKKFKPDVIAGFGGYASFAPMLAGKFQGIPLLLHEQNAIAGTCNRILSRFADKICVSMEGTGGFDKPASITGNPVRKAVAEVARNGKKNGQPLHLLVLGGSQGAHGINMFIEKILPQLRKRNIKILHQCGKADLSAMKASYARNGFPENCAVNFIDDMASAYAWADFAVCRSGASTVAELCATGLPAIFIPFPAAIHDHQTLNAKSMVEQGAALLFQERDLEEEKFLSVIDNFLDNEKLLPEMSEKAALSGKSDAACRLVDQLEEICGKA